MSDLGGPCRPGNAVKYAVAVFGTVVLWFVASMGVSWLLEFTSRPRDTRRPLRDHAMSGLWVVGAFGLAIGGLLGGIALFVWASRS